MNGADFGTSELIYPENIIINGFHFPYPLKAGLALDRVTKKWTMSIRNWGQVYGELSIMYEGRLPE